MPLHLTSEQQVIIEHEPTSRATVLAVAGSGKTTTMVLRVAWLVREQGVPREQIRAVMYNTSARADFEAKLRDVGLGDVKVRTFHAMGWGLLRWAMQRRVIPQSTLLTGNGVYRLIRLAIKAAQHEDDAWRHHKVDADDALEAIGSWKAALVPPEHAQHANDAFYEEVYRQFETERLRQGLVTFDDQIYEAVRLLQQNDAVRAQLEDLIEHFIVDEFQDVNPARLMLVRLLAGTRARVMVVGDDDQCIYEWQGARSGYIRDAFEPLHGARAFVEELDTRRGKPDDECVKITSVFKAKGLEWDHVLLPGMLERLHPDLRPFSDAAMDGRDDAESIPPTDALESERRLFYVAITRARESVAVFADPEPKRPASRFLEELALEPTRGALGGLRTRRFRALKVAAQNLLSARQPGEDARAGR
jgi:superfamily I DNA/RNA helicase